MRARAAALLGLMLGAGGAAAQEPPPLVFDADVDVVSITAVVHDRAGRPIHGLGAADIQVFEDGVLQDVSFFREVKDGPERIPLSVVLVLDSSGSMAQNMDFLREAAIAFVSKLEEVDQALVVDFNSGVRSSAEFSGDLDRLEQFVEALQAWGGTSLYDAIHYGLNRIKDQTGRKAVVVFSDGADNESALPSQDVIDLARAVEATVYCVGIRGDGPGGTPVGFLKRIAGETGGQFFFPGKVADLIQVFRAIASELHNHYALAYTPRRAADGSFRNIEVKLKQKDATIRVRKGYLALKRRPPAPPPAAR